MELQRIKHRSKQYSNVYEISRRTFLDRQSRKQRKWKQQDEMRISSMNFPMVRASAVEGRASVEIMYTSPRYKDTDNSQFNGKPLLPYMILRRERTEFIRRHKKISLTKLPDVIQTNMYKLQRYNTYCGDDMQKIHSNEKKLDKRFASLTDALSPNKDPPKEEPNNAAFRRKESLSGSEAWFFNEDDENEEDNYSLNHASADIRRRGQSRESMRKATVVFPSVPKKQATQPQQPSLVRESTQYNIELKKNTADKPKLVGFPGIAKEETVQVISDNTAPARKGILKSPKKSSRHESTEEKRDKIKQDLLTKDLKELKETYGSLKDLTDTEKENTQINDDQNDPRDNSTFHSPTMERRFSVKSATRKSANGNS